MMFMTMTLIMLVTVMMMMMINPTPPILPNVPDLRSAPSQSCTTFIIICCNILSENIWSKYKTTIITVDTNIQQQTKKHQQWNTIKISATCDYNISLSYMHNNVNISSYSIFQKYSKISKKLPPVFHPLPPTRFPYPFLGFFTLALAHHIQLGLLCPFLSFVSTCSYHIVFIRFLIFHFRLSLVWFGFRLCSSHQVWLGFGLFTPNLVWV